VTPITPDQFEALLTTAKYNGRAHVLDMVVEVPAGARKSQPDAHLVAWNNHTAEGVRLEVIGGWPVVGIRVRERASGQTVYGFGVADRNGRLFTDEPQPQPSDDWMVRAGLKRPFDREREERLGQYRVARNLRAEIARQAMQPQPGVRSIVTNNRP
jgi:hypothetical protein